MTDCVCGNQDGTNKECERCRLIARIQADVLLLRQAHSQIHALNSELNNSLGVEQTINVVELMIEERLMEPIK